MLPATIFYVFAATWNVVKFYVKNEMEIMQDLHGVQNFVIGTINRF